jgi:RHS repeat-associated protein
VLGQPTVTYNWDNADRLLSLTQGSAVVAFGYDNANRRTSVTFPNGILATYAYNARDLTGITYTLGATTLGTLTYTTDADGRRTQVGGTWARVTLPAAITTALYNANNQQTKVGTKTLTYDLNGNLTKDGNGNITYTWDARDRLTATSASNSTFQYDPLGRRTKKVISGTTTRFHYDGVNPVQELDNAGNIVANLFTGLGIDEVFTRTAGSTTRTLLPDALNSTLALADNAGTAQTTYTYEPFGAVTTAGQTNTNSYQYTGRENDGTGLDYYRARYYSPSRQRFLSEDPIGFAGGDTNLYGYVFNRPTSFTDPSGNAVDPVSWTALGITCGSGAVLGVAGTWAMAGRKPTLVQMGSGAVMGCGAATLGLVSWVAASGAAAGGFILGGGANLAGGVAGAGAGAVPTLSRVMGSTTVADTVRSVVRGDFPLDALTPAQRLQAQFYRGVVERASNKYDDIARLYNVARAEYLEGIGGPPGRTIYDFASQRGIPLP